MHVIRGNQNDDNAEGSGSRVICFICSKRNEIIDTRQRALINLEKQAEKMLKFQIPGSFCWNYCLGQST